MSEYGPDPTWDLVRKPSASACNETRCREPSAGGAGMVIDPGARRCVGWCDVHKRSGVT